MENETNNGVSSLIIDAINKEWDIISFYKDVRVNLEEQNVNDSIKEIISDIIEAEHSTVGKLEVLLNEVSPETKAVDDGKVEAETVINNTDDDIDNLDIVDESIKKESNWREWNIGDTIRWSTQDFDGQVNMIGKVTSIDSDHAIVEADGIKLWVDDDTEQYFHKEGESMKIKESVEQGNNLDTIDDIETVADEPFSYAVNTHKKMKADIEKKLADAGVVNETDRKKPFLGQKNPNVPKQVTERLHLDESALTDIEEDFILR